MKKTAMMVAMSLVTIFTSALAGQEEFVPVYNAVTGQEESFRKETNSLGVQANVEVSFMSACVIRGQVINDQPVAQPFLNISKNGVSLNVWGNYNLTDRITKQFDFNEIDLTLQYLLPIKVVEISFGIVEYTYPNKTFMDIKTPEGTETCETTMKETREVFTQIKYPNSFVVPSLAVNYDFDEANGLYVLAGLSKDVELINKLILTPSVSTGCGNAKFNEYYFYNKKSAFNNGSADVVLKYNINDNWYTSARLSYTWLWDDGIRDSAKQIYFDDNLLYGGVTVGYAF